MPRKGGVPENLKNFKPGNKLAVGKGRPKGSVSMTSVLQKMIDKKFTKKNKATGRKETKTMREWVILAALDKAQNGDMKAIDLIIDRLDGKVATNVNVTTTDHEKMEELKAKMRRGVDILDQVKEDNAD